MTFVWFLYAWEVFLFLPLTILFIFSASMLLSQQPYITTDKKTRPDNPNFKSLMSHYHSNGTVFASLDEIEIVEGVFPGNLLDEFTASLSILSNGYGYLPQSLLRLLF